MKANIVDYTGCKFSRWTVIEKVESTKETNGRTRRVWKCKCECGTVKNVLERTLVSGRSKSCGCLRKERMAEGAREKNKTHGMTDTRLYRIHRHMINRCCNQNDISYTHYGGRGIKVCDEWMKFSCFYEWAMQNGYDDFLSIDRIDVNGDYCPNNCRWASLDEQANNKSTTKYFTYQGETKSIGQWAKQYDVPYKRLWKRLHNGWDIESALFTPPTQ